MLVLKDEGNRVPPLEAGTYQAVCSWIIDIGVHHNDMYNNDSRKLLLGWEICGETVTYNGEEQPRVLTKEYTFSMGEKAILTQDLNSWRTKAFTDEERKGFDLRKLLNVGCFLAVANEEKNGKTYTNIKSVTRLPKGVEATPAQNPIIYDLDEPDDEMWEKMPEWVRNKIQKSLTWQAAAVEAGFVEAEEEAELSF